MKINRKSKKNALMFYNIMVLSNKCNISETSFSSYDAFDLKIFYDCYDESVIKFT